MAGDRSRGGRRPLAPVSAIRPLRLTDERGDPETVVPDPDVGELERHVDGRVRLRTADGTAIDGLVLTHSARAGEPITAEVVVAGWRFMFTIQDEERAALRERAGRGGASGAHHGEFVVRSVIPGRVVSVEVREGDVVGAGDRLLVVEAMKMQNEIRAPRGGSVERIGVTAGATVEVGSVLAVLR